MTSVSKNSKLLLGLSIGAGLLALLAVHLHLRSQTGERVTVFRTTAAAAPGAALGNRIEEVALPGDELYPGILEEAPTADMRELVVNTPLKEAVGEGEIVLYRHLDNTVDPGVRSHIPPGMKAISVPVDEATSVSYMVQPDDLVDVLASMPRSAGGTTSAGTAGGLANRPLIQAVRVLAVGGRSRRAEGRRGEPYSSVTLLVDLEEAQKLAYVRDVLASPMTLVLRAPEDRSRSRTVAPVGLSSRRFDEIGNRERPEEAPQPEGTAP